MSEIEIEIEFNKKLSKEEQKKAAKEIKKLLEMLEMETEEINIGDMKVEVETDVIEIPWSDKDD